MTRGRVKKKLIEVSLPLESINRESAREKSIRHGHPSTLHLYWARRPLAAARAVLFAQLVDDPSSRPEEFPTLEDQDNERSRLHGLIEDLVIWENSNNQELLEQARREIRRSNDGIIPKILDPFAGGGTIPLEAKRFGSDAVASDLNPLAVLINKCLIQIPSLFITSGPVFPGGESTQSFWGSYEGLAEDITKYGQVVSDSAFEKIREFYPPVKAPGGTTHNAIAWIWARTVVCTNPACQADVPLVSSMRLSAKKGRPRSLKWTDGTVKGKFEIIESGEEVKSNKSGQGAKFSCWVCGSPITPGDVHKQIDVQEKKADTLLTTVTTDSTGRLFLEADDQQTQAARGARDFASSIRRNDPSLSAEARGTFGGNAQGKRYGFFSFADYFTDRQLVALTQLSDEILAIRASVLSDALASGMERGLSLESGGDGAEAYADAVVTYLSMALSRTTDRNSIVCGWDSSRDSIRNVFARQAIAMSWDFVEANPFSDSSGNFTGQLDWVARSIRQLPTDGSGQAVAADAAARDYSGYVISTDPPYYDNIGYSDLSDFFYVWLRRSLVDIHPQTFATLLTPKTEELVANAYRHGGKEGAADFFVRGFNQVFARIRETASASVPLTVYYAYKQQEESSDGRSSTGWHTLLDGLISTGWEITATWPMRSELSNRMVSQGTNALASSIVLACRPRALDAVAVSRKDFVYALGQELPAALRALMQGGIAPVDLAQAAIGPGISVFSRYAKVREADGSDMKVKDALLLINSSLDEVLNEQESDFDPDTRFAVKWYKQFGWSAGSSGIADQLARSSDTSIGALERGGVFEAKAGVARLLSPNHLAEDWDPETDDRVSVWECTVRLAGIMAKNGADEVAKFLPAIQARIGLDPVKELGFLLFHEAEKRLDTKDAILFNGLVGAWGDLREQARQHADRAEPRVQVTFDFDEQGD
jgi:putative DNA methylase